MFVDLAAKLDKDAMRSLRLADAIIVGDSVNAFEPPISTHEHPRQRDLKVDVLVWVPSRNDSTGSDVECVSPTIWASIPI
jgi:hypothetical protein